MVIKKRERDVGEIPTSSMADIAFLLLVFFLVTTTINQDKGLGLVLPSWGDTLEVNKNNILNVLINNQGEIMVDGIPTQLAFVKQEVEKRVLANENLIISLKPDKSTEWERFIEVMDQIKLTGTRKLSIVDPDQ